MKFNDFLKQHSLREKEILIEGIDKIHNSPTFYARTIRDYGKKWHRNTRK